MTCTQSIVLVRLYKKIFATTPLRSHWREKTMNLVHCFREREINRRRTREANTDLGIIFLVFCSSSRTWLLGVPSSHLRSGCGTPSRSSPKIDAVIFVPSLFRVWFPTLPFLSFYFTPPLRHFCLSFFQPIGACLPFDPDTFPFSTWVTTAITPWIWGTCSLLSYSFLLCVSAALFFSFAYCLESPSHICPSFSAVLWLISKSS